MPFSSSIPKHDEVGFFPWMFQPNLNSEPAFDKPLHQQLSVCKLLQGKSDEQSDLSSDLSGGQFYKVHAKTWAVWYMV